MYRVAMYPMQPTIATSTAPATAPHQRQRRARISAVVTAPAASMLQIMAGSSRASPAHPADGGRIAAHTPLGGESGRARPHIETTAITAMASAATPPSHAGNLVTLWFILVVATLETLCSCELAFHSLLSKDEWKLTE